MASKFLKPGAHESYLLTAKFIRATCLKARKYEQQNRTTRSATLSLNELYVDVARFTTPVSNWSRSKNTKLGW